MIRTQINLPDNIHEAARQLAARQETSLAEIMRDALESHLQKYDAGSGREAASQEWEFPVGRDIGLKNGIDWSKARDSLYLRDPLKDSGNQ